MSLFLSLNVHSYRISSKEWGTADWIYWDFQDFQQNSSPKVFKKTKVPGHKTENLPGIKPCSKDRVEWVGVNA